MSDITVLGIFVADISFSGNKLPTTGETILGDSYNIGPGGKGCNQAIAISRLGGNVNFISKLGNDDYGKLAIDKLKKENIDISNIIIHDKFIPNHKVSSYFEVADLVLLPYITASQSGITQLAIHYQKPMLVNNVGGLPEVVKHNNDGFISEPNSSEIAKHILNFYDNDLLRKKIENAAKIKADQFSWLEFINMVLQK